MNCDESLDKVCMSEGSDSEDSDCFVDDENFIDEAEMDMSDF